MGRAIRLGHRGDGLARGGGFGYLEIPYYFDLRPHCRPASRRGAAFVSPDRSLDLTDLLSSGTKVIHDLNLAGCTATERVTTIGIDIGKNSLHLIGLEGCFGSRADENRLLVPRRLSGA